jgi:hypothetical protein
MVNPTGSSGYTSFPFVLHIFFQPVDDIVAFSQEQNLWGGNISHSDDVNREYDIHMPLDRSLQVCHD